jgi:hypothetical protein
VTMSYLDDIATDYEHIEGTSTVTYTPQSGAAVSSAVGFLTETTYREMMQAAASGVGLHGTDCVWEVWAATIPLLTPAEGDTITDGTDVWTVISVRKISIGSTAIKYRCVCRKQLT